MVTVENALQTIDKYGGKLDTATGELNISAKILERAEIKEAVHVLKKAGPDKVKAVQKMPHIDEHGILVIPFNCNPKYHWWAGGQPIIETLRELKAPNEVIVKYGPGGSV
jgi:predicted glycosyl hydrolase (DUF1957 family)